MSTHVVLITTTKVRPGKKDEFHAWVSRRDVAAAKVSGFISSDIIPPTREDSTEWTILSNFRSSDDITTWLNSPEHTQIIADAAALAVEGTFDETIQTPPADDAAGPGVTEVIFSKIRPGREDDYRKWSVRMQAKQSEYPGYRGMYLQPPEEAGGFWTTILRFDSPAHLEAWMNADERAAMLKESQAFIEHEQLTRLATSFPGWVPVDPGTGKGPPNWKTAMLVLLGLFPLVMLTLRFLNPILGELNSSLTTFIGNCLTVAATSFITMPLFVRWFGWWLFPKNSKSAGTTLLGVLILIVLFAAEIAALWKLLPW